MKTIDFSYFIERYNAGEMDSMEKKWFLKELEGNAWLREELNLRKKVDDNLVRHDLIDLRNKLANLEKTRKEKITTDAGSGKKSVVIRFAAALAVFMLLGTVYYLVSRSSSSPENLFKNNYMAYEYSGTARAGSADSDLSFKKAVDLYNHGDYKAASDALKDYLNHKPKSTEAKLLLGISQIENNNFDSAIITFRELSSGKGNIYLDHSQWYLALCYLKTENSVMARRELQAIVNSENYYSSKARGLLRKLR